MHKIDFNTGWCSDVYKLISFSLGVMIVATEVCILTPVFWNRTFVFKATGAQESEIF